MGSKTSVRICLNVNGLKISPTADPNGKFLRLFFPHPQRNIGLKSRPLLPVPAPGYLILLTNFQHFWCFRIRGFPMISSDLMIKLPFVSSKVHSPIVCVADPRNHEKPTPDCNSEVLCDFWTKFFRRKDEIFCYICCGRHAFCEESIENEYFMNWYEMVPSTYFQDIHGLERGNSPQLLLKVRCLEIQPAFLASCHESSELLPKLWSTVSPGATLRFTSFRTKIIDI